MAMQTYSARRSTRRYRQSDGGCPMSTPAAVERVITMTDGCNRCTHYVTDKAAAVGRANAGRYEAMCGAVVVAASLTTQDGIGCVSCAQRRGELRRACYPHTRGEPGYFTGLLHVLHRVGGLFDAFRRGNVSRHRADAQY